MTSLSKTLLLLSILTSLFGCGKELDSAEQTIEININTEDARDLKWYLRTYGKESVKEDTLPLSKGATTWSARFHRDTLDLFLLLNEKGELVSPLFPDSVPLRLTINNSDLSVIGSRWSSEIEEWSRLRYAANGEVTEELLRLFLEHTDTPFVMLLALDALTHAPNSHSCTAELTDILSESINNAPEWATAFGLKDNERAQIADNHTRFKKDLITEKGANGQTKTQKLMGKKTLMIAAFISHKQANDEEWAFIKQLDSLGYPTYYLLPMSDTIPQTWRETPKKRSTPTWHYFLTDTAGVATEWAKDLSVDQLPTYMLVDSNLLILRRWQDREDLLRFLDKYKDANKK